MGYIERFSRAAAKGTLLAAALLALAGMDHLKAQDFERTYGREDDEVGEAAQMTTDFGYIAAGYTQDPNTLETQAYVTKMHMNGVTLWERRFKVGKASQTFGMDLKQLANGDHLLVGSAGTPGCTGCIHIYAIRITDAGDLVWYRTYGNTTTNQVATAVLETTRSIVDDSDKFNLVIAGYSEDASGNRQGIIMRLWRDGEIRWVREYDPNSSASPKDNELMSLDETDGADIVATGFAKFASTNYDVWVLRVDGLNGMANIGSQGSATFGTGADDKGYSIDNLDVSPFHTTKLVIAGESFGRSAISNSEILMLRTDGSPCSTFVARFTGDNGPNENYARSVREIKDAKFGTVGDVIVTGTSRTTAYSRSLDLFLQQFDDGTMAPVTAHHVYGGRGDDGGNCVTMTSGVAAAGFIVAGYTESAPPAPVGHRSDLYLIRTDVGFKSCTDRTVTLSSAEAPLTQVCDHIMVTIPEWTILCAAGGSPLGWSFDLCE